MLFYFGNLVFRFSLMWSGHFTVKMLGMDNGAYYSVDPYLRNSLFNMRKQNLLFASSKLCKTKKQGCLKN